MTDTIYYFSGTGNSRYLAHMLGKELGVRVRHITDPMLPDVNEERESGISSEQNSVGLVFPVYSWGVPPLVIDFLKILLERGVRMIWAVMSCGDETAMAPEMLIRNAEKYGIEVKGIWSVIMPNNYVILPGFGIDSKEVENKKLQEAPNRIKDIASHILNENWKIDVVRGSVPVLKTLMVYPLFKRWGIFPKKWKSGEKCIGCGKCAAICTMKNITIIEGKPQWGQNCVSCLGCFHICPTRAIDYGSLTKGKSQYYFKNSDSYNSINL